MASFNKRQGRSLEFIQILNLNWKFPKMIGFSRISRCHQKCTDSLHVFADNAKYRIISEYAVYCQKLTVLLHFFADNDQCNSALSQKTLSLTPFSPKRLGKIWYPQFRRQR
jgi:hypothetical protein